MKGEDEGPQHQKSLWSQLVYWSNLEDVPHVLRDRGFWGGIIVRTATILCFLLLLNIAGDLNDMNELLFKGMVNMLYGICPYGQSYTLTTFGGVFTQDFFNYPPFAILFHIPALLWPGPPSLGTLDFMPGFVLLHTFFDFVLFYRLYQEGHTRAPYMIWINPGMVFLNVSTFISLPLLLLTLTLVNIDKASRSGLYAALLATSYQLGIIFLPFLLLYHISKNNTISFFLSTIIVFVFSSLPLLLCLSNPFVVVNDIVIAQFSRNPVNWADSNPASPFFNRYYPAGFLFMGSIPAVVFNIAIAFGVPPSHAPRLALPLMVLVGLFGIVLFYYFYRSPRKGLAIFYPGILLTLLIASTTEGLTHYWVMMITLPFLAWRHRSSLFTWSAPSIASA